MSKRDGRLHLMELLGRVEEKYVLEAEYSEQELANLKAGASVPVIVKVSEASDNKTQGDWPGFGADQGEAATEEDVDSTTKVEKIPVVGIIMGVALVAAAILLAVFLWHPDRTDVVSTTESSVEETTTDDGTLRIDEAHFPDVYFRKYIQSQFDANGDGILDEEEIASAKEIDLDTYEARTSIRSLAGIEYLTQLERLVCSAFVTELDVSQNEALRSLSCRHGSLRALDVSTNLRLTELDCSGNNLGSLDVSKNYALTTLRCSDCGLSELNVRNNLALKTLVCNDNNLETLDVGNNTSLTELNFANNRISEIDLSRNTLLASLFCKGNTLDTLDVRNSPQLAAVICDPKVFVGYTDDQYEDIRLSESNFPDAALWEYLSTYDKDTNGALSKSEIAEIKVLDLRNDYTASLESLRFLTSVEEVYWQGEGEIKLEVLSYFPKLKVLDCFNRNMGSLDVSSLTELEELRCGYCNLSELNVSRNSKLQVILCEGNSLTTLDVSQNEALVCLICDPGVEVIGMQGVKQNDDANGIPVDAAHFPDRTLRRYVAENVDANGDGVLDNQEIQRVTKLAMWDDDYWAFDAKDYEYMYSLKGIEFFTNLQYLDCSGNPIMSLDMGQNSALKYLDCSRCRLTSLDVSQDPALEYLDCSQGELTSLDVSHNPALKELRCYYNDLITLDVVNNPMLEMLVFTSKELKAIDVSHNPLLNTLEIEADNLAELDVSHNPALEVLMVYSTKLAELDLSHNPQLKNLAIVSDKLVKLDLSHNPALKEAGVASEKLTELNVSHNALLERLYCEGGALTELDVSHNPALVEIHCSKNRLTTLDVSHNPLLRYLYCSENQLETLDVSANPELSTLQVDDTVNVIGASENFDRSPEY